MNKRQRKKKDQLIYLCECGCFKHGYSWKALRRLDKEFTAYQNEHKFFISDSK